MMYGGGWTADSCRKSPSVDLASMFKLPMVHLEDCPTFSSARNLKSATIRYGTEVLVALDWGSLPLEEASKLHIKLSLRQVTTLRR